jgi:hypothetical protein
MPPTDVTTHINVGPPDIDFLSFLGMMFDKFVVWFPSLFAGSKVVFGIAVGLSFPISLFFLIAIIYCVEQLKYIRKKEALIYDTKIEPAYQEAASGDKVLAHKWENVVRHMESPNQNDWKQAILEADMILDDILTGMGYRGESIGEKLKRVATGDMKTLDDAWEAHKVRNHIAHESGFSLGHYEAKQTIARYRNVFEEFYYI